MHFRMEDWRIVGLFHTDPLLVVPAFRPAVAAVVPTSRSADPKLT